MNKTIESILGIYEFFVNDNEVITKINTTASKIFSNKIIGKKLSDLLWNGEFKLNLPNHFITPDNTMVILTCYEIEPGHIIAKDVTVEHKAITDSQIESEKFYSLFENPAIGISFLNLDTTIIDANKSFCEIIDYVKNEILDKNINEIFGLDLINIDTNIIRIETKIKRKNGFFTWINITNILRKSVLNEPLYYVCTIQDISEKKFFEEKSKENEKKYEILVNNSFNAIVFKKLIYDKEGEIRDYLITDANIAFEKATGLKKSEIINRPMLLKAQKHFGVSKQENTSRLKNYDRILKDGKDVHFRSQSSRTFTEPIDVYYYIVDRTENLIAVVFGNVDNGKAILTL